MKRLIASLLCFALVGVSQARSPSFSSSFWDADIWVDPERPFLFYGDEESTPRTPLRVDLHAIRNLETLKRIVRKRLETAVMDPTEANVAAYLEANYVLIEKAGRFSEAWRDTLLNYPAYDWTTRKPTVNAASTTLSREAEDADQRLLQAEQGNWGLILFGDSGRLTGLMRPIAVRFAALVGFEKMEVAVGGESPYLSEARIDRGQAKRTTKQGLSLFPALVLVRRTDRSLSDARLLATGVVDVAELTRRTARLIRRFNEGVEHGK